jgi:hypothetical protein
VATQPQLSDSPAVQQQYLAQLALTAALVQAVRGLWSSTNPLASPEALSRLRRGVLALVQQLSGVGSSIALDYYQAIRLEAGVTAPLPTGALTPASLPPASKVDAGIEWAMRAAEKQAQALAADMAAQAAEIEAAMQTRMDAAVQKALMDTTRQQVWDAVAGDEQAIGFRRVPRPGACYFCVVQAIRSTTRQGLARDFKKYGPGTMGAERHYGIYKSRLSAGEAINDLFEGDREAKFHNNCHCVIEPVFSPADSLPDRLAELEHLYDTYDEDEFGKGLPGFRRALAAHRGGHETSPPPAPTIVAPNPQGDQINALLDLLSQVA